MSIYFCGAINGGRQKQSEYKELINHCKQYGKVWNENVGKKNIRIHKSCDIYSRNMNWIDQAKVLIAEVSVPSLGVGMEIEHAIGMNPSIPILCLFDMTQTKPTSRMITNCPNITLVGYADIENAKKVITEFLKDKKLD